MTSGLLEFFPEKQERSLVGRELTLCMAIHLLWTVGLMAALHRQLARTQDTWPRLYCWVSSAQWRGELGLDLTQDFNPGLRHPGYPGLVAA